MKIYTGKGDDGKASTLGGERILKSDTSMHFIGTADELNAHLGLIRTKLSDDIDKKFVYGIQNSLMKLMAHVSDPAAERFLFTDDDVNGIEREIGRLSENERLPKLFKLVIPGEGEVEAHVHIARTVARRAERYFVALNTVRRLDRRAGVFLNRLSDYLYVLAYQV